MNKNDAARSEQPEVSPSETQSGPAQPASPIGFRRAFARAEEDGTETVEPAHDADATRGADAEVDPSDPVSSGTRPVPTPLELRPGPDTAAEASAPETGQSPQEASGNTRSAAEAAAQEYMTSGAGTALVLGAWATEVALPADGTSNSEDGNKGNKSGGKGKSGGKSSGKGSNKGNNKGNRQGNKNSRQGSNGNSGASPNEDDNGTQGEGKRASSGSRRKKDADKLNVSPPKPGADAPVVLPPATAARRKRRHVGVVISFFLLVVAPFAVAAWYMYERAADQYASTMGFSVRKEESANAAEILGGAIDFGSGNTADSDVLYEFIQSQGLVELVDQRLDLRSIYSIPENDPVFSLDENATIEDLVSYWGRMVTIYYDGGTGLIQTRALAFRPDDSRAISQAILDESTDMINRLTTVAREDATRHARVELEVSQGRLKQARSAMTEFRARTQIVDPHIDIQGQMGLLNNLQAQLADALIDLDLLLENTREGDPRLRQAEQRIAVIETRISAERNKFGIGDSEQGSRAYATLVGDYESLVVDREFAEKTYLAALANFDVAQAEAQRKTRYLAAYSLPTLAQSAEYPQRIVILSVFGLFILAAWSIGALVYYSVRDRR